MARRSTSTSAFGASKRESHDASGFYRRFTEPGVSADSEVADHRAVDKVMVGDARQMGEVPDASVALVVTSPPYFAGKEYEEALGSGGVPADYLQYLDLLRDVLAECLRKLEPGGRMAVNVANLGRRPYRSLATDVVGILQDDLRMLLRGEIVWVKQKGSSGSCAWGSFQRPGNPVLRDTTERVIVAAKGRFDRALAPAERENRGLPFESTMTRDDFMENTLDVWDIAPESASRIGHPAPFPVELPARLIALYTYRGDLVLDPFVGSGTTAVAAVRAGRHYAGYDLDESYVRLAETRIEAERRRSEPGGRTGVTDPDLGALVSEGRSAKDLARAALVAAGFSGIGPGGRRPGGLDVTFTATGGDGRQWLFEIAGPFASHRPGLQRSDVLWRAIGRAAVLREAGNPPLVLLTTGLPTGAAAESLRSVVGTDRPVRAVVDLLTAGSLDRLASLAGNQRATRSPNSG